MSFSRRKFLDWWRAYPHKYPAMIAAGHRDHGIFRREARSGAADGEPRERPDTGLYDRRNDQVSLDEVERILI